MIEPSNASSPTAAPQVAIVGLGLIGLSIGLALKQNEGQQPFVIVGCDKDAAAADHARKVKAVDRTVSNLVSAAAAADLVILDLPLPEIRPALATLAKAVKPGCVITDTASLKQPVLQAAAELLPKQVFFVGGHPVIAESGGDFYKATAALFAKRPYCLTVSPTTAAAAVQVVSDMAERLGATVLYLDATEHDGVLAGVETLPAILAAALLTTARQGAWKEAAKMAGAQFESSTRLSAESASLLAQVAAHNRDSVLSWLNLFSQQLDDWRGLVAGGETAALEAAFSRALSVRGDWMLDRAKPTIAAETPELPAHPNIWMRMLGLGGRQLRGEDERAPKKS